ncbi:MAG TPA: MFS transporter [Anaerolineales bacterium]|nr:MFS transporter [Anaerolineales bacterium]
MTFLRALRIRPFALLWSGQAISRLGDNLYRIALSWWVLEKTGSAAAMGAVAVFSFVPMLLFLLVGGVVVDRLPRFRIMLVSDVVNFLVVGLVSLLAFTQRLEVWHIYAASIVFGLSEAFFYPAYSASVPQIVPPESLPSANSLTSLTWQVSGVLGPSLGAMIVALGGTAAAFALDSLSFLISAAFLVPLLRVMAPPSVEKTRSPVGDVREGLSTVLASPFLWVSILVFAFINVTEAGPRNVALPFLIHDKLALQVEALGFVGSAFSIGSVTGAILLGRFRRIRRRGWLAYGAIVLGGVMVILIGLAPTLAVLIAVAAVHGVTFSVINLVWTNTLQEMVPTEKLGRVSSIDALGSFVLMPAGFALAGLMTDSIGPGRVFVLGGAATIALALLALLHPGVRRLD